MMIRHNSLTNFGWNGGGLTEFTVSYDIMSKALPLKDPPMHLLWGASVADADSSFDVVNTAAELREFVSANGSNHDSCAFGYKAIEYLAHDVRTRQKAIGVYLSTERKAVSLITVLIFKG